jgi:ring-1,2-phenylacetyl-CoA epoxidase subunit PaaB
MRTYEVFLRRGGKEAFEHAGSLEAPSDELAVLLAREAYARRHEGEAMWVVAREHVLEAGEELLAPNADKPHRHNDGALVAARRRGRRAS